ncbi:MAG: DUF3332 domain-containing protein [Candidatus Amulumruptor caecigallinarius]|nr:DUF3332 domain-containing protein [Candidatus Amulumruptor caecigallinarius]
MKKYKIAVGALILAGSCLTFSSCIGSFGLTNKVIAWNKSIGPKFVNELVFVCFWILPVYEVTGLADLLVINSIEFWSGRNPMTASTKVVDTEQGRYYIACDGKGYTVTSPTGHETRLEFMEDTQSWTFENAEGEQVPFMTFIDDTHVKMLTPNGDFTPVELSSEGLMAYRQSANAMLTAQR